MGASNTLLYVIAAVVILHFIAGIAFLVYKIGTAQPVSPLPDHPIEKEGKSPDQHNE